MRRIRITAGSVSATAVLNDSDTANAIWDALPIEARGNTWGDEIYFGIPVYLDEAEDSQEVVALGDLGTGRPAMPSRLFRAHAHEPGYEIRPASRQRVGKVEGDATVFKKYSAAR